MKKAILFKTLVDILYILHFVGLIAMVLIIPLGTVNINQEDMSLEELSLFYWVMLMLSLFTYIIFLRGLYFLRKMARFLLKNNYFSDNIIESLKKSGNNFLSAGIISFAIIVVLWINKLYGGKHELIYDNNLLIPLFLTIIGVFFIIQSNALNLAKGIKEENELTV